MKSAMISWNGSRLSLTGSVTISEGAYLVDMNAFADSLDLKSILEVQEERSKGKEQLGSTRAPVSEKSLGSAS